MAGLFVKDIRLIMQRKKVLLLFLALSVFIGYSQEGTFILGYLPMLMIIVMVGTISYDEYDNGCRFLMTLPIDSRIYVLEKYIFCIAGTIISGIVASLIYLVTQLLKGENIDFASEVPEMIIFPVVMLLFVALMLPLQIKFGAEKSRVTLLVFLGIVITAATIAKKIIGFETFSKVLSWLNQLDEVFAVLLGIIIVLILLLVSYLISYNVMKNKEY